MYCGEGYVCHTHKIMQFAGDHLHLGRSLEFGLGVEEQQSIVCFTAGFEEPHGLQGRLKEKKVLSA